MKSVFISFSRFIKEIYKDAMLAAMTIVPLLLAFLFKFGVPAVEAAIQSKTGLADFLSPYYLLFDLMIIFSTPILFGYSALMVILEERDLGIMKYLCVTPMGKKGYLFSRLFFLSALSALYAFAIEMFLHISDISVLQILLGCIFSFLTGIWIICLIAVLAANKIEGLAFSKFSGLLLLGPFAAFFVKDWIKYLSGFLPTFWFTQYCLNDNASGTVALVISFLLTGLYMTFAVRKFIRKSL